MQSTTRVALDAMGGDNAPAEVVKGAVDAVNKRNDIKIFLIGQKVPVERELSLYTYPKEQIEIVDAPEVIERWQSHRLWQSDERSSHQSLLA